ncbi:MAG: LPS translocon maturation chaperone LptM [Immundisolibacter sp.]|uniref:LPS translocon maturation chaperone LptM n=1 Tax=Immundisolibacter sp. TaxID=1934948 RepID=UPI003EE04DBA
MYLLFRRSGRALPAAVVALTLLLSSCGQTGPLYLPSPQAPASPADTAPETPSPAP